MDLKRGIDLAVEKVVDDLKSHAKKVTSNSEIAQVGTISANGDTQIGRFLAEAMQKVDNDGVITVEEAKLTGLQTMLPLLESVVQTGKPLLIVAEEVEGEALATLVVNKLAVG